MRAFLSTLRMSVVESGYFGIANVVGEYLLKLLRMLALMLLWRTLFAQGADLAGMSIEQTLGYTLLSAALAPLLDVRSPASSWLHEGTMLSLYQRPMGILSQLVAQTMGAWAMHLLVFGIPVLLVVAPLFGLGLGPASPMALLSLLLAVLQGFCVDFLFACVVIRAQSISYQVHSFRNSLAALLTGAVIPFSALPFGLGEFLKYTPFATLAGAPLSIWVGLENPFPMLLWQAGWNIVLWPIALALFRQSQERMVALGG